MIKNLYRANDKMQKILSIFLIRLVAGLLFVCLIPAFFLQNAIWFPFYWAAPHWTSLFFSGIVFVASMVSVERMNNFPGNSYLLYGISVSAIWYVLLGAILLVLRLPYSIVYLFVAVLLSQIYLLLNSIFIRRTSFLRMAFIPLGRAIGIERITGVEWIRLDYPDLAQKKVAAIVADLHTDDLTDAWQKFLAQCSLQHIPVYNLKQVEEALTGRVKIHHMYENNLGSLLPSSGYMFIKYLIDILIIVLSAPLILPVLLITAISIKLDDGGSIFFNQERVGYKGQVFLMHKFRSMIENPEKNKQQFTENGDCRVTRVGKFIRKTRIDELPQFLNVIKGEMSLIGPRADYVKFVENYEDVIPFYRYRNIVKPGISGWAQVNYGYVTSVDDTRVKIEHDFYYIKNFSFCLDLLIFFKTIKTVLTGFGAR